MLMTDLPMAHPSISKSIKDKEWGSFGKQEEPWVSYLSNKA